MYAGVGEASSGFKNGVLAWDMDIDALDLKRDRDIIIPRALLAITPATFLADISNLEQVYTKSQILKELKSTRNSH